jgi:hypothetical protein
MPAAESTDTDPIETQEWLESLEAVVLGGGRVRGLFLLDRLKEKAQELGIAVHKPLYSAYQNTISLEHQAVHPGDVALEERIAAIMRWNALAMVVRANRAYGELGGHIASYASGVLPKVAKSSASIARNTRTKRLRHTEAIACGLCSFLVGSICNSTLKLYSVHHGVSIANRSTGHTLSPAPTAPAQHICVRIKSAR